MSKADLELNYFFTKNKIRNELVFALTCLQGITYFMVRNKFNIFNNVVDMIEFILDDITLSVIERSNKIFDLIVLNSNFNNIENIAKFNSYIPRKNKATNLLEKLLDDGNMVMVETATSMLPFDRLYNPENNNKEIITNIILIIWHDQNYFYYIVNPDLSNKKYFIPYEFNHEVGKMEKYILSNALQYYARFFTLASIKKVKIKKIKQNTIQLLKNIVKNYTRITKTDSKNRTYFGINAINYLIDICQNGTVYLDTKLDSASIRTPKLIGSQAELNFYIDWALYTLDQRLTILISYLESCDSIEQNMVVNIIKSASSVKTNWKIVKNLIIKKVLTKNYALDKDLKNYFINAISLNDELISQLNKLI